MTTAPLRRPRPATVPGPLAWVLWTFLRRQGLMEWLPGVLPNLREEEREQLRAFLPDLELVAEEYKTWRASDLGTSEPPISAPAARLPHEINVGEAAGVLGVTDRRVRQLCAGGALEARREGGWSWRIDRSSVELYAQTRAA